MPSLSRSQFETICTHYGITLDDSERMELHERTNERLSNLTAINSLPVFNERTPVTRRSWNDPDESTDPNNAIITECHVPPNSDGSLSDFTIGLKDNIAVHGIPLTCGSPIMNGYIPDYDAVIVSRLTNAGATITAKTNLDEFGNTGQGTNGLNGPIRNPHDQDRTAGGSSGGSAVAVATDLVRVAFGTDTGGSVRIPAAYCGIIGLKPTHGLIPITGVFENTYTLDHIGPMARSVQDITHVLDVVAGSHDSDPASHYDPNHREIPQYDFTASVENPPDIADVSFGIITQSLDGTTTDSVENRFIDAIETFENAGAETTDVTLPFYDSYNEIKNTISLVSNAAHWHCGGLPVRRDGGFGSGYGHQSVFAQRKQTQSREVNIDFLEKVLTGAAVLKHDYGQLFRRAQKLIHTIRDEFEKLFSSVDCLLTPTMPTVPPKLSDAPAGFNYAQNVRLANLTQSPAITLPLPKVTDLPVGLQLMTERFTDAKLLGLASMTEDYVSPE